PAAEPPLDQVAGTLERDIKLREHLGGELFGLSKQPEHDVLGPDAVMAELARLARGGTQHVGGGSGQPERRLARGWVGERDEPLLRGLLARPQCATDLAPACAARSCRVDELIEQLVTPHP